MLATSAQTITAPTWARGRCRTRLATNQTVTVTSVSVTQPRARPTAFSRLIEALARLQKMTIGTST